MTKLPEIDAEVRAQLAADPRMRSYWRRAIEEIERQFPDVSSRADVKAYLASVRTILDELDAAQAPSDPTRGG